MPTYALIFRMDLRPEAMPSPDLLRSYMESWGRWTESIEAEGKLEGGNHFDPTGWVLRSGGRRSEGPHVSGGESVAGYLLVRAADAADALRIASACPILEGEGTSVEVRPAGVPG
jgi:hypothetical protein